jgi:hypothetical protein
MFNLKKNLEKRKLVKYLARLNDKNLNYPKGYLESKKYLIDMIEWLIASYEGRASNPKIYLESLINSKEINHYDDYVAEMKRFNIKPLSETKKLKILISEINFLYNWVYYKEITGF